MRGAGALQGIPKRRWMWPFTWLPRLREKRPPVACCRSQAPIASTMGARAKAIARVPISMRSVARAAAVARTMGSWAISPVPV